MFQRGQRVHHGQWKFENDKLYLGWSLAFLRPEDIEYDVSHASISPFNDSGLVKYNKRIGEFIKPSRSYFVCRDNTHIEHDKEYRIYPRIWTDERYEARKNDTFCVVVYHRKDVKVRVEV